MTDPEYSRMVGSNILRNEIDRETYLYLIDNSSYESSFSYDAPNSKIYFHSLNKKDDEYGQSVIYTLDDDANLRMSLRVPSTRKGVKVMQACAYTFGSFTETPVSTSIMHRFVGENNTNERGYTIKYDKEGNVLNMNEIIEKNSVGTIYSNPLDTKDDYYKKKHMSISPCIKTPRSASLSTMETEAELFEQYIDLLYGKYCRG